MLEGNLYRFNSMANFKFIKYKLLTNFIEEPNVLVNEVLRIDLIDYLLLFFGFVLFLIFPLSSF